MTQSATAKPSDIRAYEQWLRAEHGVQLTQRRHLHFDSVAAKVKQATEQSPFWADLTANMALLDQQFELQRQGFKLFDIPSGSPHSAPAFLSKEWESFLDKTWRKNILLNPNWPDPPPGGWILPANWFQRINDIVRTTFVVKYLDGVTYLADQIESFAKKHDWSFSSDLEAKEKGYYAAHCYCTNVFTIPSFKIGSEPASVQVEIQITTQLQEVIRRLTHIQYAKSRSSIGADEVKWQWNYSDPNFSLNYLGHLLHYIEGTIMSIRLNQSDGV